MTTPGHRCCVCGRITFKYASRPVDPLPPGAPWTSVRRACTNHDCYERTTRKD